MTQETENDWLKIEDFAEVVKGAMTMGMIRNAILHKEKNGADYFFRKVAKRLYLSPSRFYHWIEKAGKV